MKSDDDTKGIQFLSVKTFILKLEAGDLQKKKPHNTQSFIR